MLMRCGSSCVTLSIIFLFIVSSFFFSCGGGPMPQQAAPKSNVGEHHQTQQVKQDLLPDLVIKRCWRQPDGLHYPTGTTVHFFFEVMNQGNAPAQGFIRISGPDGSTGGFNGPLNPGQTKVATVDYTLKKHSSHYTLVFTVNENRSIKESNYDNNSSPEIWIRTIY